MSASEKLKALDEAMRASLTGSATQTHALVAVRRALPQIVAVVEAAESAWPDQASVKMDAALAALEEALQ